MSLIDIFHLGMLPEHRLICPYPPDSYFDLERRANLFGLAGETDLAKKDLDRLRKMPDYPRFRWVDKESSIKYQEGDLPSSVGVAETFAKDGLHLHAAGTFLTAGDPILDTLS